MRRTLLALTMLPLLGSAASAHPIDHALEQQLLGLFQRYNHTIAGGELNQALALRTDAVQSSIAGQLKTPQDRNEFLNESREMVPEHVQVVHAAVNDAGNQAVLILLASKTLAGHQEQDEFDVEFARQGNGWRLGALAASPGPADIKRCNQTVQPVSAYQNGRPVSLAGRIEQVEYRPDHTLLLLVSGGTEVCAFLPARTALQQHGLNPGIMQPWRIATISGVAEQSNPQEVLVNDITVHAEP